MSAPWVFRDQDGSPWLVTDWVMPTGYRWNVAVGEDGSGVKNAVLHLVCPGGVRHRMRRTVRDVTEVFDDDRVLRVVRQPDEREFPGGYRGTWKLIRVGIESTHGGLSAGRIRTRVVAQFDVRAMGIATLASHMPLGQAKEVERRRREPP